MKEQRCGTCPTCRYASEEAAQAAGYTAYRAFASVLTDGFTCWRAWQGEMRARQRGKPYVYFNKYGRQPNPEHFSGKYHLSSGWRE